MATRLKGAVKTFYTPFLSLCFVYNIPLKSLEMADSSQWHLGAYTVQTVCLQWWCAHAWLLPACGLVCVAAVHQQQGCLAEHSSQSRDGGSTSSVGFVDPRGRQQWDFNVISWLVVCSIGVQVLECPHVAQTQEVLKSAAAHCSSPQQSYAQREMLALDALSEASQPSAPVGKTTWWHPLSAGWQHCCCLSFHTPWLQLGRSHGVSAKQLGV